MNVDLRLEYKEKTNDCGTLSEVERKDRYINWLDKLYGIKKNINRH